MSNKKVMSHDPLAGMEEGVVGDIPALPDDHPASITKHKGATGGVLVLPESLTIAEVGDFHVELSQRLVSGGSVTIDGEAVETIDGAGLQLLTAFIKDLAGRSATVSWAGASDVLRRSAGQMGVNSALRLDETSNAA